MNISGYTLQYKEKLDDINSNGYVLIHNKTGAKVVLIENDDDNKTFGIGFKTPPEDSTGVAHILEHSVLCGSEKYPIKDPFVELIKGSLNTFINAMTYPDRTIYPVSSVNDKDFNNLMDVYLNAVFFPNIYNKKEIFLQEGWHYHLEDKDDDITYNGVVYNEMKGVYSSAENILEERLLEVLMPDTQYAVSSGGNPKYIPELTYDNFLKFHKKYYHPSNSIVYLYGNLDFEERLKYIDEEYLSKFEYKDVDSDVREQRPFEKRVVDKIEYSISSQEDINNKSFYSYSTVIGKNDDVEKLLAVDILMDALIYSPDSNVKKKMIESGLVSTLNANVESVINQAFVSISACNAKNNAVSEFESVLEKLINEEINKGISKDALRGALNVKEFKYKESDYGSVSKGIYYMLYMLEGILYNQDNAFLHLKGTKAFDKVRELIETDYFESLAKEVLIDNNFKAVIEAAPKIGLNAENENQIKLKLKDYKNSLSNEEIDELINQTKELIRFQSEPATKEQLDTLPKLKREDIPVEAKKINMPNIYKYNGAEIIRHNVNTNGIVYFEVGYEVSEQDNSGILGVLTKLLGQLDTENYSYQELKNKINLNTGGLSFSLRPIVTKNDETKLYFVAATKVLEAKVDIAISLINEILFGTKFNNISRIKELLGENKTELEAEIKNSGHMYSLIRGLSNISVKNYILDSTKGIGYFDYITNLLVNFDNNIDFINELDRTLINILSKNNMYVDYAGSESVFENNKQFINSIIDSSTNDISIKKWSKLNNNGNEAVRTSTQVQYVSRVGNFKFEGLEYKGYLDVLKILLSYEYLWENVRVRGGAYGCLSGFSVDGTAFLTSYRDPHLKNTNDVYEALPEWLEKFTADEDEMFKYIIGTISEIDKPYTPKMLVSTELLLYLTGMEQADIQRVRDEILNCTQDDIRGCSKYIRALLDSSLLCVVGNETKIDEHKDMFDLMRGL